MAFRECLCSAFSLQLSRRKWIRMSKWYIQHKLIALLITTLTLFVLLNAAYIISDKIHASQLISRKPIHDYKTEHSKRINVREVTRNAPNKIKRIDVEAMSSKNHVYVSINGIDVYENTKSRGIHVVVISEFTGYLLTARIFDTCLGYKEEEEMKSFFKNIQDGRIIVFAVLDDATYSFKEEGRIFIKSLGSHLISELGFRDTWVYIHANNRSIAESFHRHTGQKQKLAKEMPRMDLAKHGAPVIANATISLKVWKKHSCWGSSPNAALREQFCLKYESYGPLCSCKYPQPILLKGNLLLGSRISSVPISIMASNRPQYLNRMLRRLLVTPGVNRKMVTVYIDGFHDEVVSIADIYEVKYVEHKPLCAAACRISQHYKHAMHETFERNPNAEYAIFLEEDLEVAVDFMDYFSQLLPVLATDESLYCISAWNDNAYKHSSHDPTMLYRVETMPGLGWLLKKKLFQKELEPQWPSAEMYYDWDMWMRSPGIRKNRECIIPDVSRTYHFSKSGIHVGSSFQSAYFATKSLNTVSGIKFDTRKVMKEQYETEIHNIIKKGEVLDHSKNPCTDKDFIPKTNGRIYVIYIKMSFQHDYETWMAFAKCFKLWDLDARGFHKAMWRLWINENHIIVVGSSSPYATHKPKDITPIYIPKKQLAKTHISRD